MLFRHFGSPFTALGNGSSAAVAAAHCPTPIAFPFTPFGLSLFDINPSRIWDMIRNHQTWLAEEALKNRNSINIPKDLSHRFNPIGELFVKDFHHNHSHATTADLLAGVAGPNSRAGAASPFKQTTSPKQTLQQQSERNSMQPQAQQQQYKPQHQQQPQLHSQQTFNVRYPSPAAYFHHQQQQQQQQQQQLQHQQHLKQKSSRQGTPSPHASVTSTHTKPDTLPTPHIEAGDDDAVIELTTHDEARDSGRESGIHTPNNSTSASSGLGTSATTSSSALSSACSPLLYKESIEQLLQRRRSSSSLGGVSDSLRSYTQMLLSSGTPGCTDTSSCKEKSSSSSTSSTPPPTSALLAQHQLLTQRLNSPSETSSLFGEAIEEETRCVVCNAHFPNVWLLEQHAALQHPHIGPGEEKPFICEQCGQSYRYRSAYAKHKEQNHRARLPADKLFTCDVCGMQFRYLKSFKKHRLNHALERLHGKKGVIGKHCLAPVNVQSEQDMVTSSQEPMVADESGEDLRINVKREQDDDDRDQRECEDQDCTVDSECMIAYNENNKSTALATTSVAAVNISSSDGIHSTNKGVRLLTTPQMETDPSYHNLQRHPHHSHHRQQQQQQQQHQQQLPPHMHSSVAGTSLPQHPHVTLPHSHHPHAHAHHAVASTLNSLNSLDTITSLINAERIPSEQFLGLNPQEASILNFLRVDAAERQRDKRPQTSRFACPFCGKCVRSKENLKLHVRKHTGERPFVCLFCGRAFGGKSDLTRHLRIHTGERPYHCESCGKCFARADYLSKHLTTHIHNAPR